MEGMEGTVGTLLMTSEVSSPGTALPIDHRPSQSEIRCRPVPARHRARLCPQITDQPRAKFGAGRCLLVTGHGSAHRELTIPVRIRCRPVPACLEEADWHIL